MKSLLYQAGSPYEGSDVCNLETCRKEVEITIRKDGRLYRFIARDKIAPEDPYIVMIKAAAFAIKSGEPYGGTPPSRAIRDQLVKSNVVI